MARNKMTRHELKAKDEITTTLQSLTEAAYARKKEIVTGVSVVVVIGLALIGWNLYSANRNANAQNQLSVAINAFNDTARTPSEKERYEKTIVEAQKTYDAYGSLPVGVIAQYYIGLSQEGLGDTAKAVETLQQVIGRGDPSIKGVAQFALGGIHRKHAEFAKAIEIYKQLYDSGGYSKAAVTFELAQLHESNNQPDQARDYYQKIIADFPESPFRSATDEALKRLGAAAPAAAK